MIPAHDRLTVPTSLIEIDAGLWDAVRLAWGNEASWLTVHDGCLVFPVFDRDGKLVLLAGFDTFLALFANCAYVEVYRVEIDESDRAAEYAVVMSMPRLVNGTAAAAGIDVQEQEERGRFGT